MTRISGFFLTLLCGSLLAAPVMAQMTPSSPLPVAPKFVPTGTWSVEKTDFARLRGLTGVKMPCMMGVNYDNGYSLRFSGGGGQMLAMAIDFRQNVFIQGRKYPTTISLNQTGLQSLTATAFSESTLIFNLRPLIGFHQQLQNSTMMELNIDGNMMMFALNNMPNSINRLEACFGPVVNPVVNAMGGPAMPTAIGVNEPPKPGLQPQSKNWDDNVQLSRQPVSRLDPISGTGRQGTPAAMVWQAKAGDDLQITLQKWANRSGVKVAWQSDRGGHVVSDIYVNGSFEQAVQQLMAQNAAALGVEANMMGSGQMMPVASTIAPQRIVPEPPTPSVVAGRWSAPAGANLQVVLQKWSEASGVEFVWNSHHPFHVKSPVNSGSSYESALQSLLGQFSNDKIRPAAQLNNDPKTGQRVLFVQSSRVL